MEVVGNFRAADPIFKWCYRESLLYSDADLARLRRRKIYLPAFQGEIPVPPAPSYWQVREPAATKQSLHRVAAPDAPAESPKAKCSGSKGGPQWGSRCSSNTSTLKHPDSTSAKKPSCPKESTPDNQGKSPQSCSSRKCGRSPSPTSGSTGCKWRNLHGEDSSVVDTTLPVSSSMVDTFHSLTGSFSDVIEPLPPLHYFYSPGSGRSQTQAHDLSQQQALLSFALHEPELQPTQLPCHWAWEPYSLSTQHHRFPPHIEYLAFQLIPLQTNNSVADHWPGQ